VNFRRTASLAAGTALLFGAALSGCGSSAPGKSAPPAPGPSSATTSTAPTSAATSAALPTPDHVVVVVFENKEQQQVQGSSNAPYFNQLAALGATFSNWVAITHPSQPNYLAMFSGSTQGVAGDECLSAKFPGPDLGGELIAAGRTFTGYAESMPSAGFTGCTSGEYAAKHNPWVDFADVPASSNLTYAAFPKDFTKLPTVAFVVPNLCDDMHDCSVATGDAWLKANMSAYADWAPSHDSLLVVTWDEDDSAGPNVIPATIVGAGVKPGVYGAQVNHYSFLRTLEEMYHLPYAGASAQAQPMTGMWIAGS
jgi:hypothetical protein